MAAILANGITLEHDVTGPADGPPLLLIMGFGTQMTRWPDSFRAGFVAAGFRVIRFDNRDVGLSQRFPGVAYTLDDMADDAAGLLKALGIESAHVAGASMGGMIAQLVALRHPARVRSLVSIMSTTGDPSLPRSDKAAQAALMAKPAGNDKESIIALALANRAALSGSKYRSDDATLSAAVGAAYDRSYDPDGVARQWAAIMASPPRTDALTRLRVPTLVLHGSEDRLIRPEAGRHTAAQIPGARYEEIEGWGHDMPPSVVPDVLARIVPFLSAVETDRAEAMARPVAPGCCGAAVV